MKRSLVALAIAAATQLAVAQPSKPGKKEFAEGKTAYANGDYLGAALHFEAAFKADPDPAYLFNVGQAYRRRAEQKQGTIEHDCQQSLFAYKKFLEQLPGAPNKSEVEGYVKAMTSCAGKPAQESPPENNRPPIEKPLPPIEKPPIEKLPSGPPPGDKPGRSSFQLAGIGIGVAGVLACGAAVYFTSKSAGLAGDRDDLVDAINRRALNPGMPTTVEQRQLDDLDKRGDDANLMAYIGWGVGGAMLLGSAAFYVFGGSSTSEPRITVAPSPQGAMVLGAFRF